MDTPTPYKGLACWVQQHLKTGLALNDNVLGYMEVTFGSTDLALILAEADSSEIDSLLELVFYPDTELQMQFESLWGHTVFSADDQAALIALLQNDPLQVPIHQPSQAPAIRLRVPDFAIEAFMKHLNITWQPPIELAQILENHLSNRLLRRTRVHLRNSVLTWQPHQVLLMRLLVTHMANQDDYEACLTFMLSILDEFEPRMQPYAFLAAKKFFYFQSLCRAEDFERKRQTSNMEILILQGERFAYGSIEEWRGKMQRIDRICQALFGRTEFYRQPLEQCLDVRKSDDGQDFESVFRMLT